MKTAPIFFLSGISAVGLAWSQTNIAKENQPSVVCVETVAEEGTGLGSGFFVEEDMVATNWHVVDEAQEIEVHTSDGKKSIAKLWIASPQHDLALLKLEKPLGVGRKVRIRDGEAQELETVYVCGHPEALAFSWSSGTVANAKRILDPNTENAPNCPLIQINAAISQGSSGGPVFDQEGRLLGIITGHWQDGQNLNFAIPVFFLMGLIQKGQNLSQTEKDIWESEEWKEWRKAMASKVSWQEKYKTAAQVLYVHGPVSMMFVDLGSAAYRANEVELAQKSFSLAVHYEPKNPRAWIGKGLVALKAKNKQEATDSFQKALELGKKDEDVTLTACQGLERAGQRDEAIDTLKKAVYSNPDWEKVRSALSKTKETK